mmetsp:Transcript_9768/g.16449  ORF Transcript_9768/g.16449 Transcript_9768/m.16449 type:complete len:298 (-) Transcript_9768:2053-2946(-)
MQDLSKGLQLYVTERLHANHRWKELKVILSDAFVPGEGEHKILDFIRSQRQMEGYSPNVSHCIMGADADLIMLGLSTHEAKFYILRESLVDPKQQNRQGLRGRDLRDQFKTSFDCQVIEKQQESRDNFKLARQAEFQFLKIPVLREYLYMEFKSVKVPFTFDFERIVDDFVFLCFFVGNDFLPHLPSLGIREGALDALMFIYRNLLPSLGDYLTNGKGGLNLSLIDVLFKDLSRIEEEFFKHGEANSKFYEQRRQRDDERDRQTYEQRQQLKKIENQGKKVHYRNEDKRTEGTSAPS